MDFHNRSAFVAQVARATLHYDRLTLATVVAKRGFEVDAEGRVHAVADQLPLSEPDVETDLGTIDGDLAMAKACCDLAVLGHAVAPGREAPSVDVSIEVGEHRRDLVVFGDRTWETRAGRLQPTPPKPFAKMPITYDRAYGGAALHTDKLRGAFADNPLGKGFLMRAEDAPGTLLPNVEEADDRIQTWDQQPVPAGLAPLPRGSAMRGMRGIDVDLEAQTTRVGAAAFSFAHPKMQMGRYPGGERVTIRGMTATSPWTFVLPVVDLVAEVRLGDASYAIPLVPDTLVIFPDYARFFVVARRALVYEFLPERLRSITVAQAGELRPSSEPTRIAEELRASSPRIAIGLRPAKIAPLSFDELRAVYPITDLIEHFPLCASG